MIARRIAVSYANGVRLGARRDEMLIDAVLTVGGLSFITRALIRRLERVTDLLRTGMVGPGEAIGMIAAFDGKRESAALEAATASLEVEARDDVAGLFLGEGLLLDAVRRDAKAAADAAVRDPLYVGPARVKKPGDGVNGEQKTAAPGVSRQQGRQHSGGVKRW